MKTKGLVIVVIAFLSMSSFAQESQKRFGLEFNSGVSMATKKIDDAKLNLGFGFEGILHYRFMPHLGVYGGWGWNRLGSDDSFAGKDVCFEETGYVIGLNFKQSIAGSRMAYYARAGALYNHIETENAEGAILNDSKHGFGFQVAGGIDLNLGKNWSITPGIKFNSLIRDTNFEGAAKQLNYQYLSARIGVIKRF